MQVEGQASEQEPAKEQEAPQFDPTKIAALVDRVEQLEATNQRLLTESKLNKEKAQKYKSAIEVKEEEDLMASKNFDELLRVKEQKVADLEANLKELKTKSMTKSLQIEVAKFAGNAHDLNDVFNNLPKDRIAYNDSTSEFEGVSEAVRTIKESKPWLFKTETIPGMAASRPEVKEEKTLAQQAEENPEAVLRELLKQQLG